MIAADLRFEGFDVRSWTNLLSLFLPGVNDRLAREAAPTDAPTAGPRDAGARDAGTVLIVVDSKRVVLNALHSLRGRIPELIGQTLPDHRRGPGDPLAAYGARYASQRVLVLREGTMEELAERLALRFRSGSGYVAQLLDFFRVSRELLDAGMIELWPLPALSVPIPPAAAVDRALDLFLPEDRAAVLVLWPDARETRARTSAPAGDAPELYTALVLRRRRGELDLVAGPDLLTRWSGPLGGDWRRDHRVILDAVRRTVAPVHVGVFTDEGTFRRLLRDADPGAWAREIGLRNLLVTPMPTSAKLAIGAGALRGVGQASARLVGGLDIPGTLLPIVSSVRNEWTTIRTITDTLGFDPLRVLAAFLQTRDHGSPLDDARPLAADHLQRVPSSGARPRPDELLPED